MWGRASRRDRVPVAIVYALPPGFDPTATSGYTAPSTATAITSSASYNNYVTALTTAFNAAPQFFQNHLCGLTAVFVTMDFCGDPSTCRESYSWGYRENAAQVGATGPFNRYIAVSQGLLSSTLTFGNYYSNFVLNPLLGPHRAGAYYSSADVETGTETVLAALAHELGHVRWYDVLKADHTNYNFPNLDNYCYHQKPFFEKSWSYNNQVVNLEPPPWVSFGDETQSAEHQAHPYLSEWNAATTHGKLDQNYSTSIVRHSHGPACWARFRPTKTL